MAKKQIGLTFNYNGNEVTLIKGTTINTITKRNTIAKTFENAVLSIENGKRIEGYVKVISEPDKPDYFELYPKEFRNAIIFLTRLGVHSKLIDEQPKKKTKGKYIIVNLTTEQEAELNHLKEIHKNSSSK